MRRSGPGDDVAMGERHARISAMPTVDSELLIIYAINGQAERGMEMMGRKNKSQIRINATPTR